MALHVPKAPGFAQMLKDGAMVSPANMTNDNVLILYLMITFGFC